VVSIAKISSTFRNHQSEELHNVLIAFINIILITKSGGRHLHTAYSRGFLFHAINKDYISQSNQKPIFPGSKIALDILLKINYLKMLNKNFVTIQLNINIKKIKLFLNSYKIYKLPNNKKIKKPGRSRK